MKPKLTDKQFAQLLDPDNIIGSYPIYSSAYELKFKNDTDYIFDNNKNHIILDVRFHKTSIDIRVKQKQINKIHTFRFRLSKYQYTNLILQFI